MGCVGVGEAELWVDKAQSCLVHPTGAMATNKSPIVLCPLGLSRALGSECWGTVCRFWMGEGGWALQLENQPRHVRI